MGSQESTLLGLGLVLQIYRVAKGFKGLSRCSKAPIRDKNIQHREPQTLYSTARFAQLDPVNLCSVIFLCVCIYVCMYVCMHECNVYGNVCMYASAVGG